MFEIQFQVIQITNSTDMSLVFNKKIRYDMPSVENKEEMQTDGLCQLTGYSEWISLY